MSIDVSPRRLVERGGLGSLRKPLLIWHPASPNLRSGRYFDWEAKSVVYNDARLRESTEKRHAALTSFVRTLGVPIIDRTEVAPPGSVHEMLSLWHVPCPLVLIWDKFNSHDAFTLDGATASMQTRNLLSVTFDGARPPFGFSRELIDLSAWDGESQKQRELAQAVKTLVDVHDAFVSYARVDRPCAERVCVGLSELSWNVWWDDALTAGETFADVISGKLSEVGSVIVLWTAGATVSEWVLAEAAAGRDRGVLIPVQLENAPLPSGFEQIHTLKCFDRSESAVAALCGKITAQMLKNRLRPA